MATVNKNNKAMQEKKLRFKKKKVSLVFDEDARREFLTGFHKRKIQRRKKAKEELEEELKAERKRIKQQAKESYKRLVVSHRPIPELEEFLSTEVDMETHSVTVTEFSPDNLSRKNCFIGANQVQYEEKTTEKPKKKEPEADPNSVEGMDLVSKKRKRGGKKITKTIDTPQLKTSKDVKKIIRKQSSQMVKQSKAFQKQNQMQKVKNLKVKKREENKNLKTRFADKRNKHRRN